MSWVTDIVNLIGKLSFYEMVYQYQQGLFFRLGTVRDKRLKKVKPDVEKRCKEAEQKLIKEKGRLSFLPFRRPEIPEEYKKSWVTGLPLYKDRFSKLLQPGFYLYVPFLEDIVKDSTQENIVDLDSISVPTLDEGEKSKVMMVSCNLRYELMDLNRAYLAVNCYKTSLQDHTLAILAKYSMGKTYEEWKNPKIKEELEKTVLKEIRETVTEKWGIKIHYLYITHNVKCDVQVLEHGGKSLANVTFNAEGKTS